MGCDTGMIALGLGCIGEQLSVQDVKQTYLAMSGGLFGGPAQDCENLFIAPCCNGERYSSETFMKHFESLLTPDTGLLDAVVRAYPSADRSGANFARPTSRPAVFVVATNVKDGVPLKPFMLRNYENTKSDKAGNHRLPFTVVRVRVVGCGAGMAE
jgi:hypothetical protein